MAQTAAQIVNLACQIAKVPGYTIQGGQMLNLALQRLCLHYDLKVNRLTTTINVQGASNGPFLLELDYLRTYDLFYQINGLPFFLNPVSTADYDAEFKDPSIANYPYEYASDLSPQENQQPAQLFIYPQSSGPITLTHRYMCSRPDITDPQISTVVPWFSDQDYLIKATAVGLFQITDDERKAQFEAEMMNQLRTHLIMEDDQSGLVKRVELDPRAFKTNRYLKPTKITD